MTSTLERFKADLTALIAKGDRLELAIRAELNRGQLVKALRAQNITDPDRFINALPSMATEYQSWYSEAQSVVKQILPDRLSDFVSHYQKPRSRKELTQESYRIEDYLQGLTVTRGIDNQKVAGPDAAVPQFQQQLAILKSARNRFESSLFDIRQVVQADLFDSELEAAEELAKKKFTRACGAMAGVVIEKHLLHVCEIHQVKISKKHPCISDFNDALKAAEVIDVKQWRFIQLLADIRNMCDHNKAKEPTTDQVNDLLSGVRKIIKSVF